MYGYNDTGLESINGQQLGISLNPVKAIKKVGKGIAKGVKAGAKGVAKGTVAVAKTVTRPIVAVSEFAFNKVTAPLRSRVNSLKSGRARKLAQQRRGSNIPTVAENAEAKAWTKAKLKSSGPQGYLLALFAGAEDFSVNGLGMATNLGFEPATMTLIAASVPPLMLLLNNVLKKAGAAGEIATQTVQAYAASNIPGYQPMAPAPYVPPAEAYVPEAAPQFEPPPEEAPMEGYFGATPSNFKTGALITGLALVSGTGVYFAMKRKRRRRR